MLITHRNNQQSSIIRFMKKIFATLMLSALMALPLSAQV